MGALFMMLAAVWAFAKRTAGAENSAALPDKEPSTPVPTSAVNDAQLRAAQTYLRIHPGASPRSASEAVLAAQTAMGMPARDRDGIAGPRTLSFARGVIARESMKFEGELAGLEIDDLAGSELTGWKLKINFRKLGRTLKKIAKNPIFKTAVFAAATAFGGPAGGAAAAAFGMSPAALLGAKKGAAALAIQKRAQEGDPQAQEVLRAAMAAADGGPAPQGSATVDTADLAAMAARKLLG